MKKKLAQILAVVLAVSCFSGCEFLLADESDNGSESGYLESVEPGDSGSSGNEITVDIESEKVNSEAEWNAAFDFDLSENYVMIEDLNNRESDDEPYKRARIIAEIDKKEKKCRVFSYDEEYSSTRKNCYQDFYCFEKDKTVYTFEEWEYDNARLEEHIEEKGAWEKSSYSNFDEYIEDYDLLMGAILCEDCIAKYRTNGYVKMMECENFSNAFSYVKYTYDEAEKVYTADLTALMIDYLKAGGANIGEFTLIAKICLREGRVCAFSWDIKSQYFAYENLLEYEAIGSITFLIGAADIELPPFEYEAEDSSQESA